MMQPTEDEKKTIKLHSQLPHVGTLKGKLWALIGGPQLSADEIKTMSRSIPAWALDDMILISSIKKAIEYDEFLLKVKSGEIKL